MSIFRTYSPQTLWVATLTLVNTLFHIPPTLPQQPSSYFTAILCAHQWIRNDLKGIFEDVVVESTTATIEKVHTSCQELEKMLFNSCYDCPATIKGCHLYTEHLTYRLQKTQSCSIV